VNLQENIQRIKEVMGINEQIPDSRFQPRTKHEDLPSIGLDDTIDLVSAAIDGIPGIGNLVSAGIDIIHTISYIVRYFFSKTDEERIENATLAFITLGATFIPIAGNSLPIMVRTGIKQVLKYTPAEIMIIGQKLGMVDRTKFFLFKNKFQYLFLLVLAKFLGGELAESLTEVSKKLSQLIQEVNKTPKLKYFKEPLQNFNTLVQDLKKDADIAVKISSELKK
jgi:hypothetical protein